METLLVALGNFVKTHAVSWLRRNLGKLIVAGAVLAVIGTVGLTSILTVLLADTDHTTDRNAASACRDLGYDVDPTLYLATDTPADTEVPTGGELPGFGPGETGQQDNARTIVAQGQAAGVPERGLVIAVATALQESVLVNLDGGDRDSAGVFQQRPSQGWGTLDQVRDVGFAARAFFGGPGSPHWNPASGKASPAGLLDVSGWDSMTLTQAAQAVQRSGFPDAYAKHEERARVIVTGILTGTTTPGTDTGIEGEVSVRTADDFRANGVDIDSFCAGTFTLASARAPYTGPSGSAGAWGGYSNGQIPVDALAPVPWAAGHLLRPDATAALAALNDAYRAQFGRDIEITDSYRTYAQQVAVKRAKGYLAATPGTSNHGWALALDLSGGINVYASPQYQWMRDNAPTYGWDNPTWARPGGSKLEPWHWEYGTPSGKATQ